MINFKEKSQIVKVAKVIVIVLVVLVAAKLIFGGAGAWSNFPKIDPQNWQAVFLTNNQVYFGHVKNLNSDYVTLRDIFYLRVAEPLQQGSPPQPPAINLVKLGGELHGPQDLMYIPKDKIMFWENLKPDSQIVQAISGFLGQQQ